MILNLLLIVLGIVLVIWGADRMTDGSVAIAQRLKIPQIVIGLTIVAMGTSMPELCISMVSALKGTPDLAVGNVVGSNIFNTMLIVGVAAMVAPMTILRSTVKKDIPWAVFGSVALLLMCLDNDISRIDAIILFAAFTIFMFLTLKSAKKKQADPSSNTEEEVKSHSILQATTLVIVGLACLIFGSNIFVDAATKVAQSLGVSEAIIGLTIVAGGTSLPELATSVVAARKGQSAIAIGNVIGSNVMNILLIIGATGIICPMHISGITPIDLGTMTISIFLLWLFSFTRFKVERWEGAVLTILFGIYLSWLIYQVI
ncbi:MAG: calcium/sodium antiporter [Prevotella sp.]|nr:calcium/sodium antiporter [Prevotella sp.]